MSSIELRDRIRNSLTLLTRIAVWGYVAVVLACLFVLRLKVDDWWLATVVAFGPTWVGLLPLAVLVPVAAMLRARLLVVLGVTASLFVFGVMGLCVPWPWPQIEVHGAKPVSCMTCNIHGRAGGWRPVLGLLELEVPDIVALQEVGVGQPKFPKGWHSVREGKLIVASPFPITTTRKWIREEPPRQWPPLIAIYAVVEMPGQTLHVCNVHLTSPHWGLEKVLDRNTLLSPSRSQALKELIALRNQESKALARWIEGLPQVDVILGDFNMPVESRIYRQWWSEYDNAFSTVGFGFGYTRWVNVQRIAFGVRIDHVLTSDRWAAIGCRVGPDVKSDHLPVVAEIVPR